MQMPEYYAPCPDCYGVHDIFGDCPDDNSLTNNDLQEEEDRMTIKKTTKKVAKKTTKKTR